jgi:hypothetical protein
MKDRDGRLDRNRNSDRLAIGVVIGAVLGLAFASMHRASGRRK